MFKSILIHSFVFGMLFVLCIVLVDGYGVGDELLAILFLYGFIALVDIIKKLKAPIGYAAASASEAINTIVQERDSKKVRQELLEYKKLLDAGILSEEEYNSKVKILKKKIVG